MSSGREDGGVPEVEKSVKPRFCWYNRSLALCCGCRQQSCSVRCLDCFSYLFFRMTGMYEGGNFSRSCLDFFLQCIQRKAGKSKKVLCTDTSIGEGEEKLCAIKVGVRIYEKRCSDCKDRSCTSCAKSRPVMLFIHGGGYVLGNPGMKGHDDLCRDFAKQGFVVVSVDYRLAPEHPFPAAVQDCYRAMEAVWRKEKLPPNADPEHAGFVVAGDSAGGNLSFVMASLARDGINADLEPSATQIKVKHALLLYPAVFAFSNEETVEAEFRKKKEEHIKTGRFYIVPKPSMEFFYDAYAGNGRTKTERHALEMSDRRISPVLAGLSGLPPITLVSAGVDPLRLENLELAKRLKEEAIPCKHLHYEKMPHGFATFFWTPQYRHCFDQMLVSLAEDLDYALQLRHCAVTTVKGESVDVKKIEDKAELEADEALGPEGRTAGAGGDVESN